MPFLFLPKFNFLLNERAFLSLDRGSLVLQPQKDVFELALSELHFLVWISYHCFLGLFIRALSTWFLLFRRSLLLFWQRLSRLIQLIKGRSAFGLINLIELALFFIWCVFLHNLIGLSLGHFGFIINDDLRVLLRPCSYGARLYEWIAHVRSDHVHVFKLASFEVLGPQQLFEMSVDVAHLLNWDWSILGDMGVILVELTQLLFVVDFQRLASLFLDGYGEVRLARLIRVFWVIVFEFEIFQHFKFQSWDLFQHFIENVLIRQILFDQITYLDLVFGVFVMILILNLLVILVLKLTWVLLHRWRIKTYILAAIWNFRPLFSLTVSILLVFESFDEFINPYEVGTLVVSGYFLSLGNILIVALSAFQKHLLILPQYLVLLSFYLPDELAHLLMMRRSVRVDEKGTNRGLIGLLRHVKFPNVLWVDILKAGINILIVVRMTAQFVFIVFKSMLPLKLQILLILIHGFAVTTYSLFSFGFIFILCEIV